jgi:predicted DNA-binding transcriptional regulator AlpA
MRRELSKVAKEAALALLQNPGAQDDNAVILRGMIENKSAEDQACERFLAVETVYRARHIWLATLGAIVGKRYVWESTRDTRGFLHTGEVAELIGVKPSQMPKLIRDNQDLPQPIIKNKRLSWHPDAVAAWVDHFKGKK